MRILFYTQFCTPEPLFKSVPFAGELIRRGHDVRILTGFPNYPSGQVYPGYQLRVVQREVLDGVPILRIPLYPSHSPSALARAANYLSFTLASALPALAGWKPDVVYVYNLVTLGAIASLNKWLRGVPFVLDLQDVWPDSILSSGMLSGWISAPISALCNVVYRNAAVIAAQSHGFSRLLQERGVVPEKIEVIYNWYDDKDIHQAPNIARESLGFNGWFNILYAGNMGAVQGLEAVIDAAAIVARQAATVRFVLMGRGVAVEKLKERAAQVAPNHVKFLPACSGAEALAIQRQADALLVHLQKSPLFEVTIPSKVQSYLATGRPILCGLQGDAASLVRQAQAGVIAEPQNPESIARAALEMARLGPAQLEEMGRSGRAFYERELTAEKGISHFESIFRRACSEPVTAAETRVSPVAK